VPFLLTLTRYLARSYLVWFGIFLFGTVFILGLFDLAELVRRASNKPNITMGIIVELVLLKLPSHLQHILPFTAFFSAIFSFWRLNQHHELVVLRTTGASGIQILVPYLIVGLCIGGMMTSLLNPFAALLVKRYHYVAAQHFHKVDSSDIAIASSGLWLRQTDSKGGYIWRVGRADMRTGKLFELAILQYNPQNVYQQRFDAAEGEFRGKGLYLSNVWVSSADHTQKYYDRYFMPTTLSLDKLRDNSPLPEIISFWKLPHHISLLKQSGFTSLKYELHWHSILANCFWLISMVVLGGVCAMRPKQQRQGIKLLLMGFAISFMLFFLKDITYAMGQAATLPPFWAIWLPFIICSLLGGAIFIHVEET
jgi:lipopolysaccharide export system permease protein